MKPGSDDHIIAALKEVEVPEPSPLFWEHLSQRVHDAVAAEPSPSSRWTSRFNFAWAGGIAAGVSIMALALLLTVRHQLPASGPVAGAPSVADAAAVTTSVPSLEDDASWTVMGELASEMDFDEAGAAGLTVAPGTAESALSELSGDEQVAVVQLLQQEIKNSKSL